MSQHLYTAILFSFIALIIFLRLNKANIRGRMGERRVSSRLSSLPNGYDVYNDVYIEVQGRSVQIDHVVISRYGVFVIETKNYTGWIYGTDQSEYWTKNMYGNKYLFRNPVRQNYAHVKSLENVLRVPESAFIPIVVFMNKATLKRETTRNVIYHHQLKRTIQSYTTLVFSETEVERMKAALSAACIADKKQQKMHTHRIKEEVDAKRSLVASGVCPRCKGNLVLRKGQYGEFWGCSNYPQCTFKYSAK